MLTPPRLDLKQHPLYEECKIGLAKTHYYGGIRKHQWMARPLALHGVVVKTDGRVVRVEIGEDPSGSGSDHRTTCCPIWPTSRPTRSFRMPSKPRS